jgi:hypothetical protein
VVGSLRRVSRASVVLFALVSLALPLAASAGGRPPSQRQVRPIGTLLGERRVSQLHRAASSTSDRAASRPSVGASSATLGPNFEGVPNLSPFASPSDSTGAAGPDFLFGAVNVHVEVFDRAGTVQLGPIRLNAMFRNLPHATDTDPKVVYDSYDDHFVLTYLLYNNHQDYIVVVAIPGPTADRKGTWCHWVYVGDQVAGDGHQFADYDGLGFTADRVTVTTNNFQFSGPGYDYAQILSFKKSQLYDPGCGTKPRPVVFAGKQTREPDGSKAFTLRPAETVGGTAPKIQYLTSFDFNGTRPDDITLWRLKAVNHRLRLARTSMAVGEVNFPPYGGQCGGTASPDTKWDTGDTRLINAFYDVDTGDVYTAHAVAHQFGNGAVESAARWYDIRPAGQLSGSRVARMGVVGRSGYDVGWPSVGTDASGVLFVNYDEASDGHNECISSFASTIDPGQTTPASRTLIKAGEARYEFSTGIERWGDYTALTRDPGDATGATMVLFSSYAHDPSPPSSTTFLWDEWVAYLSEP